MSDYIEYTVKVFTSGNIWWYKDGKRHREDGPACEHSCGDKWWYRNGKLHREDGPAMEFANGLKHWYLEGIVYSEEEFNAKMSEKKNPCNGKVVEIDGKKYKLTEI